MPEMPGIEHAITSNEVFWLETMPKRIVIVGGGYIANEFAGIFHQFGSHVTLVNRSDTILRGYDEKMRDRLMQISMAKGIDFRFKSTFDAIEKQADGSLMLRMTGCDDIEAERAVRDRAHAQYRRARAGGRRGRSSVERGADQGRRA